MIIPALDLMEPKYRSKSAALMLLNIGYTESQFRARDQGNPAVPGPAYSFYQIEMPTFVTLARDWPDFPLYLNMLSLRPMYESNPGMLLQCSELFSTIAARGLLWSDYYSRNRPLPDFQPDNAEAFANYYAKTWRPADKPKSKARFSEIYSQAFSLVAAHY